MCQSRSAPVCALLVQQAVAGEEVRQPPKTAALMCGMKEMVSLSTNILIEKGVAADKILLNF